MLLLRERAKFSPARRKVKIAAGIAKAMSRTHFGLTTQPEEIAAVRSKNEFLEVPLIHSHNLLLRIPSSTNQRPDVIDRDTQQDAAKTVKRRFRPLNECKYSHE